MDGERRIKLKIQIYCGDEIAMGPGKADLLAAIDSTGSISAGARAMGMSYRRAWLLVDAMNRCWSRPLVETVVGGGRNHGATVTPLGFRVLKHYRALVASADAAARGPDWTAIEDAVLPAPRKRQGEDA